MRRCQAILSLVGLCFAATSPAYAEEVLVDLVVPRQAPRGNALLPAAGDDDARAAGGGPGVLSEPSSGLALPSIHDLLTFAASLETDFDGRVEGALSSSGRALGIDTDASIAATLVGDALDLTAVGLRLVDPDHGWSIEAGDHQSLEGQVRGVRLGWRNGLLEPTLGVGLRSTEGEFGGPWVVGGGLALRLGPTFALSVEGTSSGRGESKLSLEVPHLRLGLLGSLDGGGDKRALGLSLAFDAARRRLTGALLATANADAAGATLGLQSRLGWRTGDILELSVAHQLSDDGARTRHGLLARVSSSPTQSVALDASWHATFAEQVAHLASLRGRWRPTRAIDAELRLDLDPARSDGSALEAALAWRPARLGLVRVSTTLPLGTLLPDAELLVEHRAFEGLELRLELGRASDGAWSGRVGLVAGLGVQVPARGAEIHGRVVGPGGVGLPGIIVSAGPWRRRTEADGSFAFRPLDAGPYSVTVDRRSLPAHLTVLDETRALEVRRPDSVELAFRVVAYGRIAGRACLDADGDGRCGQGEGAPLGLFRCGERMAAPEPDGSFVFDNVLPGRSQVRLDPDYLKKGFEPASASQVELELGEGGAGEVTFLFREKRRALRMDALE